MDASALEHLQSHLGKRKAEETTSGTSGCGAIAKFEPIDCAHNASILNAANAGALASVLSLAGDASAPPLKSDSDEQLLLGLTLAAPVKLHSIRIAGPDDGTAPKTVKIFANKTNMSFDDCEDCAPTQTLTLSSSAATVPLQFVKFQNVSSLTLFVEDNQEDGEVTSLSHVQLIGTPLATTNMKDLKKGG